MRGREGRERLIYKENTEQKIRVKEEGKAERERDEEREPKLYKV